MTVPSAPPPNTSVPNAFTVDLEEWYQGLTSTNATPERWPALESRVEPATDQLLALLDDAGVHATFFVLGEVADRLPSLIARIAAAGHEIASHGYAHRFVDRLTPDQFAADLARAADAIERACGHRPHGHRAPYFSLNGRTPWAWPILADQGYLYDSSLFPARSLLYGAPHAPRHPFRLPGVSLWEFPVAVARPFGLGWPVAGGFYTRVQPYPLIRHAIRRLNAAGHPAVLYVHPWELDLDQPPIAVTARERLTHFTGRRALAAKLNHLLADFMFVPLHALYSHYANDAAPPTAVDTTYANRQPAL